MITSFAQLAEAAKTTKKKMIVAVVEAQDEHTMEAVCRAHSDGMIEAILIGNEEEIRRIAAEQGEDLRAFEIIHSEGIEDSLRIGVDCIRSGRANAIMKGKLETGQFMRAIVKKENGFLKGGRVSLVGLYEHPSYPKLLAVTDQGMNTYPDLNEKKDLIINGVQMLHALGNICPKIACLCAVEKVNPKMPETVDAYELKQMNQRGEIPGCIVEGPISFDLAIKKGAAAVKGFDSPVSGEADLLLVPSITCGNVLAKCMTDYSGAVTAGTILGANCPVILTSRSAAAKDKYYSIALAAYTSANGMEPSQEVPDGFPYSGDQSGLDVNENRAV